MTPFNAVPDVGTLRPKPVVGVAEIRGATTSTGESPLTLIRDESDLTGVPSPVAAAVWSSEPRVMRLLAEREGNGVRLTRVWNGPAGYAAAVEAVVESEEVIDSVSDTSKSMSGRDSGRIVV